MEESVKILLRHIAYGSTKYVQKIDEADANTTYVGWAKPGSATSVSVWRIKKILVSGTITTIAWADGDQKFDNEWDERANLSYS